MPDANAGRGDRLRLLLILLAVGLIFAPSLANGFTYDDALYAKAETDSGINVMVKSVQPLADYFRVPYGYPQARHGRGFRPITVLSLALTRAAAGGGDADPAWPHHLVNVLLHVLAAWLVYVVVRRLTGPGWPPLLAAAVFGAHAIRSDTVIAIVGRAEILAFVFGVVALLLYLQALAGARLRLLHLALAAVALFLALGSKEGALGWAVLIPLFGLVALRGARSTGAAIRAQVLPLLLTVGPPVAAFFLLRHAMLAEHGQRFLVTFNANPLYESAPGVRALTGVVLLAHGLWQTLFPFHLACDWGAHVFRLVETAADVRFLGAAAVLLALAGVGLWCVRRHGLPALAVAQFLGFAFVTSNILVPIETIYAERLYYIPAVGLSLLVAWVAVRFTGQAASARARAVVLVVVGGWCVLGAGWCVKRCFDWRDMETLVFADVGVQPRSLFLNLQASGLSERRGDRAQRDRFLEQARKLDPTSPWIQMTGAHYRLAEDDLEAAARMYADALTSSRLDAGERPYVRQNLAAILLRLGRRAEARASFTAIVDADAPLLAHSARVSLLWMAHQDGDVAETRALITAGRRDLAPVATAIGRERAAADFRLFEGLLAYRRGDHKAAVEDLARALSVLETRRSDPRRVPAVLAYIESLAVVGQLDAARKMTASYLWSPSLRPEDRPKFQALARRFGLERTIQRR